MKPKKIAHFVKKLDGWRGNAALYRVVPPMEQTAYGLDGTEETTKHGHIVVSGVHHAWAHETTGFPADSEGNTINMLDLFCTRGTTNHRVALANAGYELVPDPIAKPAASKPRGGRMNADTVLYELPLPYGSSTRITAGMTANRLRSHVPPKLLVPLLGFLQAELLGPKPAPKAEPRPKASVRILVRRTAAPIRAVVRTRRLRAPIDPGSNKGRVRLAHLRRYRDNAARLTDSYCAGLLQMRIYGRTGRWIPRGRIAPCEIAAERRRLLAKRDGR